MSSSSYATGRRIPRPLGRYAACTWITVLIAVGCSEGREPESSVPVDTIANRISAAGTPADSLVVVEPSLAVGAALEPGPESFGNVRSVELGVDGTLYVADDQALEIRQFGPSGSLVRALGRAGQGPGEFRALYSLTLRGDTLFAHDPRNVRFALFDVSSGQAVDHWPATALTGRYEEPVVDSAGRIYARTFVPGARSGGLEVLEDGTSIDTLVFEELLGPPGDSPGVIVCQGTDGGIHSQRVPFSPRQLRTVAPSGEVVAAWSDSYAIHFVSLGRDPPNGMPVTGGPAAGDTVRVIRLEAPRIPLPPALRDSVRARYERWRGQSHLTDCDPEDAEIPEFKPFMRSISFDGMGRMWVETYRERGYGFDVFDPSGRLIERFTLTGYEQRGAPPAVRGGRVAVVAVDSLGVAQVLRYDLLSER